MMIIFYKAGVGNTWCGLRGWPLMIWRGQRKFLSEFFPQEPLPYNFFFLGKASQKIFSLARRFKIIPSPEKTMKNHEISWPFILSASQINFPWRRASGFFIFPPPPPQIINGRPLIVKGLSSLRVMVFWNYISGLKLYDMRYYWHQETLIADRYIIIEMYLININQVFVLHYT